MKKQFLIIATALTQSLGAVEITDETEKSAEEFYGAALYSRAAELYRSLLQENPKESWQLRLAQCLFCVRDYESVVTLLESCDSEREWRYYLHGTALSRLGRFDEAVQILESAKNADSFKSTELQFELGLAWHHLGFEDKAAAVFGDLANKQNHPLSKIYLARLHIQSKNHEAAQKQLANLAIDLENPLYFEKEYLLGQIAYNKSQFEEAINHFSNALPSHHVPWATEALYLLGWSKLKEAEKEKNAALFSQAYDAFSQCLDVKNEERSHLALGQTLLTQAKVMRDPEALNRAEQILTNQQAFVTKEGKSHALLLRAEAAPSHKERDALYRQLTQETNRETSYFSKGWFFRGLNDFEEGQKIGQENPQNALTFFERAAKSFKIAAELLPPSESFEASKLEAQCYLQQESNRGTEKAFEVLSAILNRPEIIHVQDPAEIYHLHALAAAKIAEQQNQYQWDSTIALVKQGLEKHFDPNSHFLLAILLYRNGNYLEAKETFLAQPSGKSLFWAAKCCEMLQEDPKPYRQKVWEDYPNCELAAEAYFTYYNYRDYMQGDRFALKHLEGMEKKFPNSPFLLNAHYLIGIDYKRDRLLTDGKKVRKRDLNAAIESLSQVETTFDRLYNLGQLPKEQMAYFVTLRYYATLERALTNFTIAEESEGAKRQIFLEYAEEVFTQIINSFQKPNESHATLLKHAEPYPPIEEESAYWLAKTRIKAKDLDGAKDVLNSMLTRYQNNMITRGYFLSRVWYEMGQISMSAGDCMHGLTYLQNAEDASKGKVLNTDERLDLWIQQALCYRDIKDYDQSILILTRVTNENVASSLRLKAMYLRGELYELQNRPELARNQFKALAKKSGEWSLLAKKTLEERYGY